MWSPPIRSLGSSERIAVIAFRPGSTPRRFAVLRVSEDESAGVRTSHDQLWASDASANHILTPKQSVVIYIVTVESIDLQVSSDETIQSIHPQQSFGLLMSEGVGLLLGHLPPGCTVGFPPRHQLQVPTLFQNSLIQSEFVDRHVVIGKQLLKTSGINLSVLML